MKKKFSLHALPPLVQRMPVWTLRVLFCAGTYSTRSVGTAFPRFSVGTSICIVCCCLFLLTGCRDLPMRAYLYFNEDQAAQSASNLNRPVRFEVNAGEPARLIGQNLEAAGLIEDAFLFEAYVRAEGLSQSLAAGIFILSPDMSLIEIVGALQRADAASVIVTIREGWRLEQVADYLAQANVFGDAQNGRSAQAESYRQQVSSGELIGIDGHQYTFLQTRLPHVSLEGYLFPDTYQIPLQAALASDLIRKQLDAFAQKPQHLYESATAAGMTDLDLYTVLTLASIVEREAMVAEERPLIARVYLNRMVFGMRLEADPTVQYAMGYQPTSGQWWKTPVSLEEYAGVNSPYNTYLNVGLPPGPIASPGLSSIQAAIAPAQTDALYFVALPDGSGRHVFATSYEEHLVNVQKYMQR